MRFVLRWPRGLDRVQAYALPEFVMPIFKILSIVWVGLFWAVHAQADVPRIPGNLLVQYSDNVTEFDTSNTSVGTLIVPNGVGVGAYARDIVVDELGQLHVYNGTFDPILHTLAEGVWSDRTAAGWSTVNNGTYGGIASIESFVFVTDMDTGASGGADSAQGVIRFDLEDGTWTRFAEDIEPIDLSIGLDGLLYALYPGGSPGGRELDVYDPLTLDRVDSVSVADIVGFSGHRSVAADAMGNIFVADWSGNLVKFNRDGDVLAQTNICVPGQNCNLYDIDVASDGRIAVGDRVGGITLTDVDFVGFSKFFVSDGAFVSFVPDYDDDLDQVADAVDNCTALANGDQLDADADGFGNACDTDVNNDCLTNVIDLGLLRLGFFGADPVLDFSGDGVVNATDLGIMRSMFFSAPGPSALSSCD